MSDDSERDDNTAAMELLAEVRERLLDVIEQCDTAVAIAFAMDLLIFLCNAHEVPPMCVTAIFVDQLHKKHHEHENFDAFLRRAFTDMKNRAKKGEPD